MHTVLVLFALVATLCVGAHGADCVRYFIVGLYVVALWVFFMWQLSRTAPSMILNTPTCTHYAFIDTWGEEGREWGGMGGGFETGLWVRMRKTQELPMLPVV